MKKENILNKILICAYIIIALLAINTIILFASNVKITSDSKTNEETTGNTEYDEFAKFLTDNGITKE